MTEAQQSPQIVVGIAKSVEDKEAIYRLRYQIYHQEMGKLIQADHNKRWIVDELDETGHLFYAKVDDEVVGTIRLNTGTAAQFPSSIHAYFHMQQFQEYAPEQPILSYSSRLMVSPRYRSSQVLYFLLAEMFRYAMERGLIFNFCYCAPQLVGLYEQLGFRRYTKNVNHPETGFNVPMVLVADDVAYMRQVRSPLYRLALRLRKQHSQQTADWFTEKFPNVKQNVVQRALGEQEFWSIINEKLQQSYQNQQFIFQGLNEQELKLLLRETTVLRCDEGDLIVKDSNVGNEMFIVLSGAVEVTKTQHDMTYSIAILGEGDVFGEMAFVSRTRRTATVTAVTGSEIMVLTREFFRKFIDSHPTIASKVLLNLAVILCDRLGRSTGNWIDTVTKLQSKLQSERLDEEE